MAKKSNKVDLPDWALGLWKELGSPALEKLQSVHHGDLLERRNGLRRDDLIKILIDARALLPDADPWVRGRLISSGKPVWKFLMRMEFTIYCTRYDCSNRTHRSHTPCIHR